MLQRNKLNDIITNALGDYPDIAERWQVQDPTVTAMLTAIRELVIALSQDNAVNIIEPFIKSKDSTIIADAINKGILPVATPCQYWLSIENNGAAKITLSAGRVVEDGLGREWRLLSAVTIGAGERAQVLCEQSTQISHTFSIAASQPFFRASLPVADDMYLASISVKNNSSNTLFDYAPKFMNAAAGSAVYTLLTDDLKQITLMFGDTARVGQTVQAGESYTVTLTQCYGEVDTTTLKQASLQNITASDETSLNLYFKYGGLQRAAANPLSVSQMRLLASFPATYDQNAVFMGNFDFLVRQHFMSRFSYMAIWNETTQEKFYGASLDNINHMNLTVVAKDPNEQARLTDDICKLVATADSLLIGRVRLKSVQERPYNITVNAILAGVHDADSVRTQIQELLLQHYGRGTIAASHPNLDGFNRQEIATLMRNHIPAFQDRISDFTILGETITDDNRIKPHHWLYLTRESIAVNITRTADMGNALWTL